VEQRTVVDWNELVTRHGPEVFGAAYRVLGNTADAEDVTQDVFLEALEVWKRRGTTEWAGLLRRMAACRAVDRLRRRRNAVSLDERELIGSQQDPQAVLLGRELADRLRRAISELPAREAEVFCLRYFEDFSYQQIANSLNITAGAAATALHKARAKLAALADNEDLNHAHR
jgi:RNA polymerase sigma-70 factor (ECF subfamily)